MTQDGRLQFNSISENDAGTYVCRARNNAGDSEARAEVIVNGKTIGKIITSLNLMMYSPPQKISPDNYTIQPISENQVTITQVSYPNEGYDDAYYSSNTQGNGGNE